MRGLRKTRPIIYKHLIIFLHQDSTTTTSLQKTFTDELLSAYSELEESFIRKLVKLLRAFEFLTLWEANNPLALFRRLATESAYGTGRLNGDVQLTEVFNKAKTYFLYGGADCFINVRHTRRVWKYSFDNSQNKNVSFSLNC